MRVDVEPLERGLRDVLDVLGPAVQARLFAVGDLEAKLGGDHHSVADRRECLADEFLVRERPVDLGGVEEGDAEVDGGPDQGDRPSWSRRPGRSRSSGPCNRAQGPRLQAAVAKRSFLHRRLPVDLILTTGRPYFLGGASTPETWPALRPAGAAP